MFNFIETPRFPDCAAWGSGGGAVYKTDVRTAKSGKEQRNVKNDQPRHKYNIILDTQSADKMDEFRAWHHAMRGRGTAFRFKDWGDYKSCGPSATPANDDQLIGTWDGVQLIFPLVKRYTIGAQETVRLIKKPLVSTVLVAVNGVNFTAAVDIDGTTGEVDFSGTGTMPNIGDQITAGFEYDVPVRFGSDEFLVDWEAFNLESYEGSSFELIEVLI